MIQRIQTIWWLLSAAVMIVIIFMPLYLEENGNNLIVHARDINYVYGPLIGQAILSLIAILLFRNRKFQVILGYLVIINLIFVGAGMFLAYSLAKDAHPDLVMLPWGGVLLVIAIIFQIFAVRGVKKDEALVKSMDRLR